MGNNLQANREYLVEVTSLRTSLFCSVFGNCTVDVHLASF